VPHCGSNQDLKQLKHEQTVQPLNAAARGVTLQCVLNTLCTPLVAGSQRLGAWPSCMPRHAAYLVPMEIR
jgi:hypothetical protein